MEIMKNTDIAKFYVKELIYKVIMPTVFIVTHTNKRNTLNLRTTPWL